MDVLWSCVVPLVQRCALRMFTLLLPALARVSESVVAAVPLICVADCVLVSVSTFCEPPAPRLITSTPIAARLFVPFVSTSVSVPAPRSIDPPVTTVVHTTVLQSRPYVAFMHFLAATDS